MDIWNRMDLCEAEMSPKELEVCKLVREQPHAFSSATATALADRFNIAQSAISRFCQRLGFSGFGEFRLALALAVSNYNHPAVASDAEKHDLAYYMADLIQQTSLALPPAQLDAFAERVVNAHGVFVGGQGNSNPPARALFTRLLLTGIPVHLMEPNLEIEAMHIVQHTDVVILVSAQNSTYQDFVNFVNSLPVAEQPYVALIANSSRHPLRRHVDEVFCLPTWNSLHYPMMVDTALAPIAFCSFLNERVAHLLSQRKNPNSV